MNKQIANGNIGKQRLYITPHTTQPFYGPFSIN